MTNLDLSCVRCIAGDDDAAKNSKHRAAMEAPKLTRIFYVAALILLIALGATPGFARKSSVASLVPKDPSLKEYSRDGLPCSTSSALGPSRSGGSLQRLDQIERQSLNAFRNSSGRGGGGNALPYRPEIIPASQGQSSINFAYHSPGRGR
jgi:hypothetical protein